MGISTGVQLEFIKIGAVAGVIVEGNAVDVEVGSVGEVVVLLMAITYKKE